MTEEKNTTPEVKHIIKSEDVSLNKEEVLKERVANLKRLQDKIKRQGRIPLYEQKRSKFSALCTPGCVGRFVNDEGPRIKQFIEAGWRLVENIKDDTDHRIENRSKWGNVIRRSVNRGQMETIFMETPKEMYEHDQKHKLQEIKAKTEGMITLENDENAKKFKKNVYGNISISFGKNENP